jgi:ribosome-associated heat shock protein Hsp15
MRIDKWLWFIRACKTRLLATQSCRCQRVRINGQTAKPAQEIRPGDLVELDAPGLTRSWQVIGFPSCRIGAKLVPDFATETTSAEAIQAAKEFHRDQRLAGPFPDPLSKAFRPDKKQLRELRRLMDPDS